MSHYQWLAPLQPLSNIAEQNDQLAPVDFHPTSESRMTAPSERALSASSGAFLPSAPEGPQSLAVGVSPRNSTANATEPRRGDTWACENSLASPALVGFPTDYLLANGPLATGSMTTAFTDSNWHMPDLWWRESIARGQREVVAQSVGFRMRITSPFNPSIAGDIGDPSK
jgi:hypothetical protein